MLVSLTQSLWLSTGGVAVLGLIILGMIRCWNALLGPSVSWAGSGEDDVKSSSALLAATVPAKKKTCEKSIFPRIFFILACCKSPCLLGNPASGVQGWKCLPWDEICRAWNIESCLTHQFFLSWREEIPVIAGDC